jgi:hypothetical protein
MKRAFLLYNVGSDSWPSSPPLPPISSQSPLVSSISYLDLVINWCKIEIIF